MIKDQPIFKVEWIPIEKVHANDYNPNSVATQEMKLLYKSVKSDGYTQPVVTIYDRAKDRYDLSQKQRAMERGIRKTKARIKGYQTAIDCCTDEEPKRKLQESYDRAAEELSKQNATYKKFCEDNNLKRYDDRLRAAKWNRSEAAKAAATARNIGKFKDKVMSAGQTSTGVPITDVSTHLYTQANFRGPSADDITEALTSPLDKGKIRTDGSQQFIGEHCTTVINVNTGKVITCWPTKTKIVEKLKAKGASS